MSSHDDQGFSPAERDALEQQLLELHFGCHADPEALQARLANEPALRELQRQVLRTAEVLDDAARPAQAPLPLRRPSLLRRWFGLRTVPARLRTAAAAAAMLVAVPTLVHAVAALQRDRYATEHLQLTVSAPRAMPTGAPWQFTVETRDLEARATAAEVQWQVHGDDDALLREGTARVEGRLAIEIPADLRAARRVSVVADNGRDRVSHTFKLDTAAAGSLTHLTTDRPIYRPGETIYTRALLLDRVTLQPKHADTRCSAKLLDAKGATITEGFDSGEGDIRGLSGIRSFALAIPDTSPGGVHTIEFRTEDGSTPIERTEVVVRPIRAPKLLTEIVLDRSSYSPGARGSAQVAVQRMGGERAAGAAVMATIVVDGTETWRQQLGLDAQGRATFAFTLPRAVEKGAARFVATVTDGGVVEAQLKPFLVPTGEVRAAVYPEGGELIADVDNRIYLECTDPLGRFVDTSGVLLDARGNVLSKFATEHQGRARLTLRPRAGERYRLQLAGNPAPIDLPEAQETGIAMTVLDEQTPAGQPLRVRLAGRSEGPALVAVFCRGVLVGQASATADAQGRIDAELAVPLLPHAFGVLRTTVFDHQLRPVAERLVRRATDRRIDVAVAAAEEDLAPGAKQRLTVRATDERGQPIPAVLGMAVTDLAIAGLAEEPRIGLVDQATLFGDVERVERLGDFFAATNESARNADLLLGTRGWRRFVWQNDAAAQAAVAAQGKWGEGALAREGFAQTPQARTTVSKAGGAFGTVATFAWQTRNVRDGVGIVTLAIALLYFVVELLAMGLRRGGLGHPVLAATGTVLATLVGIAVLLPNRLGSDFRSLELAPGAAAAWDGSEAKEVVTFAVPSRLTPEGFDIFSIEANPLAGAFFNDGDEGDVRARTENYFGAPPPATPASAEEVAEDFEVEIANGAVIGDLGRAIRLPRVSKPVRRFAYEHKEAQERADYPATIFWTSIQQTNAEGVATVEFDTGDAVTTWRIDVDAHAPTGPIGRVGQAQATFRTRLPLAIDLKLPDEISAGDELRIPIVAELRGTAATAVAVRLQLGPGLRSLGELPTEIPLSQGRGRIDLPITALDGFGSSYVRIEGRAGGFADRLARRLTIVPRGFPQRRSVGGQTSTEAPGSLPIVIPAQATAGRANFTLFPSPLSALTAGLEGMLQEPHGCFEQASSTNYPNTLVLALVEATGDDVPAIAARARTLLPQGYRKITGYECKERGYEWFGGDPAHESLTAYGLLQFADMRRVYDVDAAMIERTKQWLLARRDGAGRFKQSERGLDTFGRAPQELNDAYVCYALLVAGVPAADLRVELDALSARIATADAYQLAVIACAMQAAERGERAAEARRLLASKQAPSGEVAGAATSITRSGGRDLAVETTAFAMLAWLSDGTYAANVRRAAEFLQGSRRGNGAFGATQATVMALRALTAYAEATRAMREPGTVRLLDGDRVLMERSFGAGEHDPITFDLWPLLNPGEHSLTVQLVGGGGPLPWACDVEYRSEQPADDPACVLDLRATLRSPRVAEGESVAVDLVVTNRTQEGQPMTIAVVGIPAGLEVPTAALNDLQRGGAFAFWELRGRELALYWRDLAPGAVRELTLDLLARVPGRSVGPASRAYLYYTPDQKRWARPLAVEVTTK